MCCSPVAHTRNTKRNKTSFPIDLTRVSKTCELACLRPGGGQCPSPSLIPHVSDWPLRIQCAAEVAALREREQTENGSYIQKERESAVLLSLRVFHCQNVSYPVRLYFVRHFVIYGRVSCSTIFNTRLRHEAVFVFVFIFGCSSRPVGYSAFSFRVGSSDSDSDSLSLSGARACHVFAC